MTLDAVVYTSDGVEAYDDVGAAIDAPGETWVHGAVSEESDLEPPRDYAPRHARDDNGMLSEDYGLNQEQAESQRRAPS